MIFVTVGAQMPFDRLIRAVDDWSAHHRRLDVFAQIGRDAWKPKHIRWSEFLGPKEFRDNVVHSDVVIAHAGMGSILTALELSKPIVVMPRRGDLHETRNDHQIATAKQFLAQGRVLVAFDESHLWEKLEQLATFRPGQQISSQASPRLIATLREFINRGQCDNHQTAMGGIGLMAAKQAAYDIVVPNAAPLGLPFETVGSGDHQ